MTWLDALGCLHQESSCGPIIRREETFYHLQRLVHMSGRFPLLCGNLHGVWDTMNLHFCTQGTMHNAFPCYFFLLSASEKDSQVTFAAFRHTSLQQQQHDIPKIQVKQSLQCLHSIKKKRMWGNSGRRSTAEVELPFSPLIKRWILWVVEPKLVANYHTGLSSQAQNINWGWR